MIQTCLWKRRAYREKRNMKGEIGDKENMTSESTSYQLDEKLAVEKVQKRKRE